MLTDDTGPAYRELLRGALNAVLQAESAEQLGAERYERTGERSDMRNGPRSRSLMTRIGTIELTIPRHRNVPFKTLVFDNFCRSEGALITTIADYRESAPKAMERLDDGFDDAMSVIELPEILRKPVRTTNILERLNGEVGKRTKVIRVFPNVSSIERLIGALLDEENDRWQMKRKLYYKPAMLELKKCEPNLIVLAREQRRLREAA